MHIAPARPHTALNTGHAAMHSAGGADHSILRPKITEDVYTGAQDGESLWMASAWRGQGNDPTQEQSSAASPPAQTASSSTPSALEPSAQPATGSSISIWA